MFSAYKPGWIFYITLLALLTDMVSSATVTSQGQIVPCEPPCIEYAIVITLAHLDRIQMKIYKVEKPDKHVLKPSNINQIEASPDEQNINITSMRKNPETLDATLKTFVESAKKVIPQIKQFSTPIFFLLPMSIVDTYIAEFNAMAGRASEYMNNLENFPFLPPSQRSIRIISVQSETLFKWITVNFLAGHLLPERSGRTVGVVSLSDHFNVQAAFPTHRMSMNVTQFFTVGSEPYLVVALSFPVDGFSPTLRKYFDGLAEHDLYAAESPCSPNGAQLKIFYGEQKRKYTGNGDLEACRKEIQRSILSDYGRWTRSPYAKKPSKEIQFYALPEVIPVLNNIGCSGCSRVFSPAKIDSAARRYCSGSKSNIEKTTAGCLNANFIYLMLTQAYHFTRNQPIKILHGERHGVEEDWALGALLYKLKLLTYDLNKG